MNATLTYENFNVVGNYIPGQNQFVCIPPNYPAIVNTNRMLVELHRKLELGKVPVVTISFQNGNALHTVQRTVAQVSGNTRTINLI